VNHWLLISKETTSLEWRKRKVKTDVVGRLEGGGNLKYKENKALYYTKLTVLRLRPQDKAVGL
jgi:hypothetical protein